MKRNLFSVLILVLLVVNIALTAVMMVSVTGTNKKTADLITSIAAVMNLELYEPGGDPVADISLADTEVYDLTGKLTIPLKAEGADSEQTYVVFSLSIFMNTKHEDYETYGGASILGRESAIKDIVNSTVSEYTEAECRTDFDTVREDILKAVQELFQSDFIYKIGINNITYG